MRLIITTYLVGLLTFLPSFGDFFPYGGSEHALYLSVASVEISESRMVSVEIKLFSDDLQDAVRNFSDDYKLSSLEEFFNKNREKSIDYLQKNFSIKQGINIVKLRYEGYTIENDAHFIRFSGKFPASSGKLSITASYLIELFSDQRNIVEVNRAGERKYLQLRKGEESGEV